MDVGGGEDVMDLLDASPFEDGKEDGTPMDVPVDDRTDSTLDIVGDGLLDTDDLMVDMHDAEIPAGCTENADCESDDMVCDLDGGVCVDCLENLHCPDDEFCEDMTCLPDVCTSGEVICAGQEVQVCNPAGSGFDVEETCSESEYCEAGLCHDHACLPKEVMCDGGKVLKCDDSGKEWVAGQDCEADGLNCFEGQCIDSLCVADSLFCVDNFTLATCHDDGTDFTPESCPEQHYCLKGQCLGWTCEPGEMLCVGEMATMCDDKGSGPLTQGENCDELGLLCIAGLCTKCFPDCFGKECGEDGCGGTCGLCDDGDPCTTGSCEDAFFTCTFETVVDCCNGDDECLDDGDCTIDECVDNQCVHTNICCEAHTECDDGDEQCTHDLCLNDYCWYKPISGAGCCPRYGLYEGFELGYVDWPLKGDGVHTWAISAAQAYAGGFSLLATKPQTGAELTLPGKVQVVAPATILKFYYRTEGWTTLDCALHGLMIKVNGVVADLNCVPALEWTEYSLDLAQWLGQSVEVKFIYTVPWKLNTNHLVYLDEVKIEHQCCSKDLDCGDEDICSSDQCQQGVCVNTHITGCCNPALLQENFEGSGLPNWSLSADGKKTWALTQDDKHTGSWALLADTNHSGALLTTPGGTLLPASGGTVKVWFRSLNWNTITWGVDGLNFYVNGVLTETISTPSPEWSLLSFDLSDWAGKEVTVSFKYVMGNQGNPGHRVYLDDLQVLQNCCETEDICDDDNPCTADTCGDWGACVHTPDESCCNPLVLLEDFDLGTIFGWNLGKDGKLFWNLTDTDSTSGDYSLHAAKPGNGAVFVLPELDPLPVSGSELSLTYKTLNWLNINCATDGLKVYVNGALATTLCGAAETWTTQAIPLTPWAGQKLTIEIKYQIVSGGNGNHAVFVDDVMISKTCCVDDDACDDLNDCTEDSCGAGTCSHTEEEGCCGPPLYLQNFDYGTAGEWSLSANGGVWSWLVNSGDALSGSYSLTAAAANGAPVATLPMVGPLPYSGASLQFAYKTVGWALVDCETSGVRIWVNGVAAGYACEPSPDKWTLAAIDLSSWVGQEVLIQIQNTVPALTNPGHAVWLDDLQVVVECCHDDDDCDDDDPCTEDLCGNLEGCFYVQEEDCCYPIGFTDGFEDGIAWGWSLSADNLKKWAVVADPVNSGANALLANKSNNAAVAKLPPLPVIPWEGGYMSFYYKTVDWNVVDCLTSGLFIRVNGALATNICEPSLDWSMVVVDLYPWAGEAPEITLQYWLGNSGNPYHSIAIDDVQIAIECP
jgi:hypothetical protein